ncbi:LysR family transcriptional regulator [Nocardioides sp. TF02-7]|uniref:LysR family transcriptional regulator n=1 Tax=Nocardioides sp. TF02-7 TaxID=2917724 RepID=UPI001F050CDD|nr:LysR family transcriptional regulator [Nocardioides sp. TF02-7]UMG91640.1 LysR family transcriptional regulator [Nocardioides sp. TF02-7]
MAELTIAGLRVVAEVARRGSFTAAAEALGYTQSAISRQVATAEAAVRSPIFERRARGVTLTPAGDVLAKHARSVLSQLAAAELELAGLRDQVAGRLVVGAFPLAAAHWVPRAIAALKERHPALEVDLREAGSPQQMRWMQTRRIEVALVARGDGLPDYDFSELTTEVLAPTALGIAVAATHPLAQRDEVAVADIAGEPWVVGSGDEPQFLAWPTLSEPHVAFRVASWQTRLGLVSAGLALTVMPESAARSVPRDVRWLKVRDPALRFDREAVIVTRTERSPAAEAFSRALHEVTSPAGLGALSTRGRPGVARPPDGRRLWSVTTIGFSTETDVREDRRTVPDRRR